MWVSLLYVDNIIGGKQRSQLCQKDKITRLASGEPTGTIKRAESGGLNKNYLNKLIRYPLPKQQIDANLRFS